MLVAAASVSANEQVTLEKQVDSVAVRIDGSPFTVFNYAKALPKPFFSPVRGPDGTVISRSLENPEDHKHHKGIWLAVDEVNQVKFWAEEGRIENVSVEVSNSKADRPATIDIVNHWLGKDNQPLLIETTRVSIDPRRLIIYDITFRAGAEKVTFEDTKEGLFGFRMVNSMREKETGQVVNAEGKQGTKECWGLPSAWVDYFGEVEGKIFGVTLMDHPDNFRPSRYHVRDYGLFSISPFGERSYTNGARDAAPVVLEPGETLRLRYGLFIHVGDTQTGKVAEAFKQFLAATK